ARPNLSWKLPLVIEDAARLEKIELFTFNMILAAPFSGPRQVLAIRAGDAGIGLLAGAADRNDARGRAGRIQFMDVEANIAALLPVQGDHLTPRSRGSPLRRL